MDYIFPSKVASAMKNISLRTQLEATMLSTFFIICGLIAFNIYFWTTENDLTFKILMTINAFFGIMFMSSNLITTYQQYQTHKEVMGYYNESRV